MDAEKARRLLHLDACEAESRSVELLVLFQGQHQYRPIPCRTYRDSLGQQRLGLL